MFSEILRFCQQHWLLSGGFLASLVLLFWYERRYQSLRGQQNLSPAQLVQRMNRDEVVVIDIRDKEDFQKGHILGAIHLSAKSLETNPEKLKPHTRKPIVLVCQRGTTTERLQKTLTQKLNVAVQSLEGGITAWKEADLPLINP